MGEHKRANKAYHSPHKSLVCVCVCASVENVQHLQIAIKNAKKKISVFPVLAVGLANINENGSSLTQVASDYLAL